MIDYTVSRIRRVDDHTEVVVRICEGDVTTEDEIVFDPDTMEEPEIQPVTRYRRHTLLKTMKFSYRGNIAPSRPERDEYMRRMLDEQLQEEAKGLGKTVVEWQSEQQPYNPVEDLRKGEL